MDQIAIERHKMSVKKIMLLATAAMALAAFAVPASASAVEVHHFTYETKPITGEVDAELTGRLHFGNFLGSYKCDVHSKVKVNTADAKITSHEITTNTCEGTGSFKNCELSADEVTVNGSPISSSNPATATIDSNTNLTIDGNPQIHEAFKAGCPLSSVTKTFNTAEGYEILGTTEKTAGTNYIEGFNLSGEGIAHAGGLEAPTETTGTYALTPKNKFSMSKVNT